MLLSGGLIAGPSIAVAQQVGGPTADQYDSSSERIAGGISSGDNPSSPGSGDSGRVLGLPFSGLDIGLLAVVAAMLTATGLALRRLTARTDER